MRAIALTSLVIAAMLCPAHAQQPDVTDAQVTVKSGSSMFMGEREVMNAYEISDQQGSAAFDQSIIPLAAGQGLQLNVTAQYRDGTNEDLTSSARIKYLVLGCLSVSSTGYVLATPPTQCINPRSSTVTVVVNSSTGEVMGWNKYVFDVQ